MNSIELNQTAQIQNIIGENVLVQGFESLQLGSKQDYCSQGSYVNSEGKQVYWSAAFDGHGSSDAISIIRRADLFEIMAKDNPEIELQRQIDEFMNSKHISRESYRSGATMVLAKVTFYETYTEIKFTNIGDSSGILYVNGEPIFVTKEHNFENGEEMVRLMSEGRVNTKMPIVKTSRAIEVYSRNKLLSKKGSYINFVLPDGNFMELSPSQSLGHLGVCGLNPTVTVFRILPTDNFKIVLCSDGITDMMPVNGVGSAIWLKFIQKSTAKEIVDIAYNQWKREWSVSQELVDKDRSEYIDLLKMPKVKFPTRGGYDDCCCAVMEFRKAVLTEWRLVDVSEFMPRLSNDIPIRLSAQIVEEAATSSNKERHDDDDDDDDLYN